MIAYKNLEKTFRINSQYLTYMTQKRKGIQNIWKHKTVWVAKPEPCHDEQTRKTFSHFCSCVTLVNNVQT